MQTTSTCRAQARIRNPRFTFAAAALAAAVVGAATDARGQVAADWIGATPAGDNFVDSFNWNPAVTPSVAGDQSATINNGGIALINLGDNAESAWLYLGLQPGQSGHIDMTDGTLTLGELRVGGREVLPNPTPPPDTVANGGGTGTFLQRGGTVNINAPSAVLGDPEPVQSLYIGDGGLNSPSANTANGTYEIRGGTLLSGTAANDAIVIGTGEATIGTFIQSGGDVTSTGFVIVGRRGAQATWTMSGGSLTSQGDDGLLIGDGDEAGVQSTTGTFTQTNGAVSVAQDVQIGRRSATGTYDMQGGTLDILNGSLVVGGGGGSTEPLMHGDGTLKISGSAVITIDDTAPTAGGQGNLNIGLTSNSVMGGDTTGLVDMDGGTLNLNDNGAILAVGNGHGSNGTLDISGGVLTIDGTGADIDVGRNNGNGTLNLSGTGEINVNRLIVNSTNTVGAQRQVNISGGTFNATSITFGTSPTASSATRELNISDGIVNIGFLTTGRPNIGAGGSAVTHISGGDVDIDSLEIFSNSTFRVSTNNLVLESIAVGSPQPNYRFGTSTVDVVGAVTLTIAGAGNFGTGSGQTLTKIGTGALTINTLQDYAADSNINVSQGTLNLNTIAAESMSSVDAANLGITVDGAANFDSDQRLRALVVGATGTATVTAGVDKTLKMNGLTVTSGGILQMNDNDLIVDYTAPDPSPEFALRDLVKAVAEGGSSGIGFEPGTGNTVIAIAEGSESGLSDLNGIAFDDTTVIGKYTYYGDANLDGQVTSDDYVAVDVGIGVGDSWVEGDFDFSGSVTSDDYVAIDVNLGEGSGNPLAFAELKAEMVALHTAMFGDEYVQRLAIAEAEGFAALVPEPGALGLVGIGAAGLLGRRRRKP